MKSHNDKDMRCTCGQNEKCSMHDKSCKDSSCDKEHKSKHAHDASQDYVGQNERAKNDRQGQSNNPYMQQEQKRGKQDNNHGHRQEHSEQHKKDAERNRR